MNWNLEAFGLIVVAIGGLAHLVPSMLAPVTSISFGGFTVQQVVGLVTVVVALMLLADKRK